MVIFQMVGVVDQARHVVRQHFCGERHQNMPPTKCNTVAHVACKMVDTQRMM